MKRPSDWPLHFVLYLMIFKICPVPILAIIQEMFKLKNLYLHPHQDNYYINNIFCRKIIPTTVLKSSTLRFSPLS